MVPFLWVNLFFSDLKLTVLKNTSLQYFVVCIVTKPLLSKIFPDNNIIPLIMFSIASAFNSNASTCSNTLVCFSARV